MLPIKRRVAALTRSHAELKFICKLNKKLWLDNLQIHC